MGVSCSWMGICFAGSPQSVCHLHVKSPAVSMYLQVWPSDMSRLVGGCFMKRVLLVTGICKSKDASKWVATGVLVQHDIHT